MRLNARILRLSFSTQLRHWLWPQNLQNDLTIKTAGLWKKKVFTYCFMTQSPTTYWERFCWLTYLFRDTFVKGVLIRRSIASDLRTVFFPSLSVVLSFCNVAKTVFLVNQNGGHKQPLGGHSTPGLPVSTALIDTLKKANKKKRGWIFFNFVLFFLT